MNNKVEHIVFYGTLCKIHVRKALKIDDCLAFISNCEINGSLYNLGDYPGLILNTQQKIIAELYSIKNTKCLPILDEYEEYNPNNLKDSLYLRKTIELPEFECLAWVYEYNQNVTDEQLIKNGIWGK